MKYTIRYEDSDGGDPMTIGLFDSREIAVDWLIQFADTKCPGCEVTKHTDMPGFEYVVIDHPHGSLCEMSVIAHHSADEFKAEWSV